jgi:hypothetical protein
MPKKEQEQYSDEEAERRLVAALRGSRISGHKQMADIPKKRGTTQSARKTKAQRKPRGQG